MIVRVRSRCGYAALLLCTFASTLPARAQISLLSAVDLARRNSPAVHMAQADVARASAAVTETRDAYLPSLTGGSSIGYTYGFPVGQPTIYNFQAQSLVISFSQRDYIRAARASLHSATLSLANATAQVELDTATDYLQLSTINQQLAALEQEKSYAEHLDVIEQDRVNAGVESQIAATRAELTAAQADLQRLDLTADAARLRAQLSHLTGLAPELIEPEPQSVPGIPVNLASLKPIEAPSVAASFSDAVSKHYIAHGDERQNYRPQVAFGVNYSRYAAFNNYQEYYLRFQHNNFDVGLEVTVPIFNGSTRAKARESAADAAHADAQAVQAKDQADEQTVQLQQQLPALRAQAHIADLQAQLAEQQLQAVLLQAQSAPTSPTASPVSPAAEMQSRIEERSRYSDALEAHFALEKVELTLLRASGGLDRWIALGAQ